MKCNYQKWLEELEGYIDIVKCDKYFRCIPVVPTFEIISVHAIRV